MVEGGHAGDRLEGPQAPGGGHVHDAGAEHHRVRGPGQPGTRALHRGGMGLNAHDLIADSREALEEQSIPTADVEHPAAPGGGVGDDLVVEGGVVVPVLLGHQVPPEAARRLLERRGAAAL